jgi:hypothetical protein
MVTFNLYPLLELSVLTGVEESKALLAWPAWRRSALRTVLAGRSPPLAPPVGKARRAATSQDATCLASLMDDARQGLPPPLKMTLVG